MGHNGGRGMKRSAKVVIVLLGVAAVFAVAAVAVLQMPVFGGRPGAALEQRMHASKQRHGGRFENTPPYVSELTLMGELKSYMGDEAREPTFEVPVDRVSAADLAKPAAAGMRVRWLGHATVLLEIDGVRIMTDPVLS